MVSSKNQIIKELAIFVINNAGLGNLRQLICEAITDGKEIPAGSYYLLPDKRYQKSVPAVNGFMFAMSKLKEPPYYITLSLVKNAAVKIALPLIDSSTLVKLIFHTLIIEFFRNNPGFLKEPEADKQE